MANHWGRWLKARCRRLGIPLKSAAEKVGTTPGNLSKWIAAREMPNIREHLRRPLADVLGVSLIDLATAHLPRRPRQPQPISISPARVVGPYLVMSVGDHKVRLCPGCADEDQARDVAQAMAQRYGRLVFVCRLVSMHHQPRDAASKEVADETAGSDA